MNSIFNTHIFIALLLLLTATITKAQTLASYLPQGCYHTGQYKQFKTVNGMSKPLITEGSFAFNCEYGLIWHTQVPIIESTIYRTQGDYFILHENAVSQNLDNRVYRALGKLLNNLIGGNEEYLQQNFTITQQSNTSVLTPKSKQMQKFLHSLTISRQENIINIHLDVAEQEMLDIQIFSQRKLESLEQNQCEHLSDLPPATCAVLFKGAKQ